MPFIKINLLCLTSVTGTEVNTRLSCIGPHIPFLRTVRGVLLTSATNAIQPNVSSSLSMPSLHSSSKRKKKLIKKKKSIYMERFKMQ